MVRLIRHDPIARKAVAIASVVNVHVEMRAAGTDGESVEPTVDLGQLRQTLRASDRRRPALAQRGGMLDRNRLKPSAACRRSGGMPERPISSPRQYITGSTRASHLSHVAAPGREVLIVQLRSYDRITNRANFEGDWVT